MQKEFVHGSAGGIGLIAVPREPGRAFPLWKRCLDMTLLLLSLPVVLPLMVIVAAVIKTVSKGPVFFRQTRIGYRGTPFVCWKFRTMHENADAGLHQKYVENLIENDLPLVKLDTTGDKRLIPFGGVIRALCLDELAQLINVFLGEMSMVGPRPCMDYEYNRLLPRHRQRFNTPPGMTGLWQVKRRMGTSFTQMMQMDLDYLANRSLKMDLWIVLQTIPAVIAQVRESRAARRMAVEQRVKV